MASNPFCHFRKSPVICSDKQDPTLQKLSPSSASNWWSPLFGWSSDPDYIIHGSSSRSSKPSGPSGEISGQSDKEMGRPTRSKFGLGCFTEEKAKEQLKKTMETSTFHDVTYHSAIASRLASDVSGRQER